MTTPTLAINVTVAETQLEALEKRLKNLGTGVGGQSPLESLKRQMAGDVATIKASLEMLNKHFEDGAVRIGRSTSEKVKKVKDDLGVVNQLIRQSLAGAVANEQAADKERLALQKQTEAELIAAAKASSEQRLTIASKFAKDTVASETASAKLRNSVWDELDKTKAASVEAAFAKSEANLAEHLKRTTLIEWKGQSERIAAESSALAVRTKLEIAGYEAEQARKLAAEKALTIIEREGNLARQANFANDLKASGLAESRRLASIGASQAATLIGAGRSATSAARAEGAPFSTLSGVLVNRAAFAEMQKSAEELATGLATVPPKVKDLTEAKVRASPAMKMFTADLNDAHSAARGLAGGFGQLWLTYGSTVPLIAGAALSASFVQTVKVGAEVQHTLETIRVLSEESDTSMAGLNQQMLEMSRTGPFGPLEIAKAMKTLSLAGLDASEVSKSIRTVLQFAVAGDTTIAKSAEVLTGVSTSFGYTAQGFGKVADVIAKTAAVSKSSVESMGNAFRAASVLNTQYGASLEDVALGLAVLSNINIQDSAAGTQLRNFYQDLAGRTPKARNALEKLGIEFLDTEGKAKPLIETISLLSKAMSEYDAKGQQRQFQAIMTDRGNKPLQALLDALRRLPELAKESTMTTDTYLQELANKIADHAGFVAISAAKMALTPLNQMKSVKATLEASFAETFNSLSPYVLEFSTQLKEIFNSKEFRNGLERLALGIADFTVGLAKHSGAILATVSAYALLKGALGVEALILSLSGAWKSLAASFAVAGAGLGTFLGFMSRLVPVIGLIWGGLELYSFWTGKVSDRLPDLTAGSKAYSEALRSEIARIDEANAAKREGLTLDDMKARRLGLSAADNMKLNVLNAERNLAAILKDNASDRTSGGTLASNGFNRGLEGKEALARSVLAKAQKDAYIAELDVANLEPRLRSKRILQDAAAKKAADDLKPPRQFGEKTFGEDTKDYFEPVGRLLSNETKKYNDLKALADKEYRREEETLKSAVSSREITEAEGYVKSLAATEAYYKKVQGIVGAHELTVPGILEGAKRPIKEVAAKAFDVKSEEALERMRDSAKTTRDNLTDLVITRQELAGTNLHKSISDEAEAFKKATLAIKTHNEQLEIKAEAVRTAANLPPAQRAAYTGAADYRAQFADNIAAHNVLAEKTRREANAMAVNYNRNDPLQVKEYHRLANAADDAAAHVKKLQADTDAGAVREGERKRQLYRQERTGIEGGKLALNNYLETVSNTASQVGGLVTNVFKGMEDALVSFVETGKLDFGKLADSIVRDMIRIQVQQSIMTPLAEASRGSGGVVGMLSKLFGGSSSAASSAPLNFMDLAGASTLKFAKGGAFTNGVVDSPTMFNLGEMGEAGTEAIMPLKRNGSGQLGVMAAGNSAPIVNVYVETPTGQTGKVTQTRSGNNLDIRVIVGEVEEMISDNMASGRGPLGRAIGSRFSLRPSVS